MDEPKETGAAPPEKEAADPMVAASGLRRSESIVDITKALTKFQLQIDVIPRSASNPHFKSKYADLAAIWKVIRKPLSECGIVVIHGPQSDGVKVTITTLILHESGEWFESDFTMSLAQNRITGPQAIGSCITYGKRYGMCAMLNIVPEGEDDDGEGAQGRSGDSKQGKKAEPAAKAKKKRDKKDWNWTKEGDPAPVFDKEVHKYKCSNCANHLVTKFAENLAAHVSYCDCGFAHNWEDEAPEDLKPKAKKGGSDGEDES